MYGHGPEFGMIESSYGFHQPRPSRQGSGYPSRQSRPYFERPKPNPVVESGYGDPAPVVEVPKPAPVNNNPYGSSPIVSSPYEPPAPVVSTPYRPAPVEESGYGNVEVARSQAPKPAPIAPIRKPAREVEILESGYGAYSSGGYGSSGEQSEAGW